MIGTVSSGVYLGHGWLYELAVRDHVRVSYSKNGAKGNDNGLVDSGQKESQF